MIPGREMFGQFVNKSTAKGGRIDVHHHHAPPALQTGTPGRGRGGYGPWTPELSLEMMEKFDIAVAMLSMTQMGNILYDNTEKGRAAVRLGNDYGAKLMADHPKRFGLFTGVPLPDIDGVMKEIAYGLDTLKADGIGIYTNDNQTRWPGDPYFDPMWQELNRRSTIVYMHPLAPPCCTNLNDSVPTAMNEFDFDITRACTSILANGVLHKYPNVKIIIPHSGGTMPMIAGRIKDRYPHDPKRDEVHPQRRDRRAAKVLHRHRACQLPLPDGRYAQIRPAGSRHVWNRLFARADRIHGERAASLGTLREGHEGHRARKRREIVPAFQSLAAAYFSIASSIILAAVAAASTV